MDLGITELVTVQSLRALYGKIIIMCEQTIAMRDGEEVGLLWLMGDEDRPFAAMPLCKEENLEYCFNLMVEYFNKELDLPLKIHLADEEGIKVLNLSEDKFIVRLEEDAKDYLYEGEKLRTLSGKKLHKKKNHYNNFYKELW